MASGQGVRSSSTRPREKSTDPGRSSKAAEKDALRRHQALEKQVRKRTREVERSVPSVSASSARPPSPGAPVLDLSLHSRRGSSPRDMPQGPPPRRAPEATFTPTAAGLREEEEEEDMMAEIPAKMRKWMELAIAKGISSGLRRSRHHSQQSFPDYASASGRSASPVVPPTFSTDGTRRIQSSGLVTGCGSEVPQLVVLPGASSGLSAPGAKTSNHHNRRQPERLGGSFPLSLNPGSVVQPRRDTRHKLAGAESGLSRSPGISTQIDITGRADSYGQCDSEGPHKQTRGHAFQVVDAGDREAFPLGRVTPALRQSRAHIGRFEHTGGLAQQGHDRPVGVASSPLSFSGDRRAVRASCHRPFRHASQFSTPTVHLPLSVSGSRGHGCAPLSLASRSPLRFSSFTSCTQATSEGPGGESGSRACGSFLAEADLVRGSAAAVRGGTVADSSVKDSALSGPGPSSRAPMAQPDRLEVERQRLREEQMSSRVIETIQAARRPSTNRIYNATWSGFCRWCSKAQVDPSSPSVAQLLEFLQSGLDKGLSPNTLRRQVAALSSVLSWTGCKSISSHPRVRSFLKGATNLRPPTIHRFPTWDLNIVLNALTKEPFEPLRSISTQLLTYKVVFLVAITSARRISEIAALSIRKDLCVFHEDRVVLRLDPTFLPKVNSAFHRAQELVLPNFCEAPSHRLERQWHHLDVRRALRVYIKRTAPFRKSEALFVSFLPGSLGHKVSSSTIGRWLRASIARAYEAQSSAVPQGITAHSTRSAATSAAWATQASIEEICRAATWASPS
uniref:Tyr recombinase domain-containing protein n=1 Tax=Naja naja TaxID=35670 RepID=A0A8C6V4T6_NAJNA